MKMTIKFSTYGLILQVFCASLLSAHNGNAQYKSTSEIVIKSTVNGLYLKEVFDLIESNSDLDMLYLEKDLNNKTRINLEPGASRSVYDILMEVSKQANLKFRQVNNGIFVSPMLKSELRDNVSRIDMMVEVDISGKIIDENGEGLPGASVVVKGTSTGTTTDLEGNFKLVVPDGSTIVISFVGYQTQEIEVGNQRVIDSQMVLDAEQLSEVVIVGYGTQNKAAISGSVVTLDSKKLENVPVTNLTNAIAGQLPGVIVNSPGGEPGADDAQVLIRGKGTLGNTNALVVIDGIPDRGGFSRLNPQDIESFTVLKDASAAIYGARAANGVILITTKRGKVGRPQFSASSNVSFSQPTTRRNLLDSWQEATLQNESKFEWENPQWTDQQIQLLKDQSQPLQYPNTDWDSILLKEWSQTTNHTVSARGGSETIRYFLSGQFLNQSGVFKGVDYPYKQNSLRANLDTDLTESLSLGIDILNRSEDRNYWGRGNGRDGWNSPWNYARRGGRYLVGYFPNGLVGKGWQPGEFNAAESISERGGSTDIDDNILNTKITLQWETPITGLSIAAYGAFDSKSSSQSQFQNIFDEYLYDYSTDTYTKAVDATKRTLGETKADFSTKTYNVRLGYQKSFGNHGIDAFVAYEQSRFEMSSISAFRTGLPSAQLPELFTGTADGQNNNGFSMANGRINYFGRINYDYDGKYLATVSLRHDGSQNFAPGKRYGTFPAVSIGWRLSEEAFMADNGAVDYLKLRGSWGKMGNDNVPAFQYLTSYAFTDYTAYCCGVLAGYDFGNGTEPGIFESTAANPNITWETATTINLGLEGSLFDNQIKFEMDYFTSQREGILIARNASVPEYTGLTLPDENLGVVNNEGFEIQLSSHQMLNQDIALNIGANMSYAHNEVEFYDEPEGVQEWQKYEGKPIDSWLLWESAGIYQSQSEIDNSAHGEDNVTRPGDLQIVDQNNDGVINSDDRIRIDNGRIPEIMYGINMGVTFRGFDLSVLFQGQANANIALGAPLGLDKQYFENRWGNGDSSYPRINTSSTTGNYGNNSTFWLRKADFLRLKNVSLTYSFPETVLNPLKLSNLQVYLRGNNLMLLFDDIEGDWRDPEDDFGIYPIQRSWQLGINFGF